MLSDEQRQAIGAALYKGIEMTQWENGEHPILAAVERICDEAHQRGYGEGLQVSVDAISRAEAAERALVERLTKLADEWETAVSDPVPKQSETETGHDQGFREGVWYSVGQAAMELRAALAAVRPDARTDQSARPCDTLRCGASDPGRYCSDDCAAVRAGMERCPAVRPDTEGAHKGCARRVENGTVHYACGISVPTGFPGGVYAEHERQFLAARPDTADGGGGE